VSVPGDGERAFELGTLGEDKIKLLSAMPWDYVAITDEEQVEYDRRTDDINVDLNDDNNNGTLMNDVKLQNALAADRYWMKLKQQRSPLTSIQKHEAWLRLAAHLSNKSLSLHVIVISLRGLQTILKPNWNCRRFSFLRKSNVISPKPNCGPIGLINWLVTCIHTSINHAQLSSLPMNNRAMQALPPSCI
jgi:hypothetical protein